MPELCVKLHEKIRMLLIWRKINMTRRGPGGSCGDFFPETSRNTLRWMLVGEWFLDISGAGGFGRVFTEWV